MKYVIKSSYGNDSCALIQWASENGVGDAAIIYNDTGWAGEGWIDRVSRMEAWARSLGFQTYRTQSIGLEALVRKKKGWPRQGIQFCTQELKMAPTKLWLDENDPQGLATNVIGVRRAESRNRKDFPIYSIDRDGRTTWAPLALHSDERRDNLLRRAGISPLPHRSDECFPCINSNRADLLRLTETRIDEIDALETDLGHTSKGKPRTMFRPYRYQGATGIREIVEWARSPGRQYQFDLDDGNGNPGCEEGWCGL